MIPTQRFSALICLFALCLAALPSDLLGATQATETRPNVLMIYVDDMGYGDPGCYGGRDIPTPNIDRLAAGGVRFADGYVTAAVCGPSRMGLLAGAYQQRFGCFWNNDLWATFGLTLPKSQKLMPQALAAAGYTTGQVGKWNITPDPRPYVDEAFAVMNWKGAYYPDEDGVLPRCRRTRLPHGTARLGPAPSGRRVPHGSTHTPRRRFPRSPRRQDLLPLSGLQRAAHAAPSPTRSSTRSSSISNMNPIGSMPAWSPSLDENLGRVLDKTP